MATVPSHPRPIFEPHIEALLSRLHSASETQESRIDPEEIRQIRSVSGTDPDHAHRLLDNLMVDKYIALEVDKCHFVYNLVLAKGVTNIVEVGTSFGVSAIYLALGVLNASKWGSGRTPRVIATEKEQSKAEIAKQNWREAGDGVKSVIDLRVGDLIETLQQGVEDVEMVHMDIWPHVAAPALRLLMPKLRPGAVVVTDNTIQSADRYGELFSILRHPTGPFQTITLPYKGGVDFSVYLP